VIKETNMDRTDLLAIMTAIIYSAESASSKEEVKSAVVRAGEILQEVREFVQAKKIA